MAREQQQEFLRLLNEHQGMIRKVCNVYASRPADREDLFQEIIVQLWKAYPSFKGNSKFSTWLYRISLNLAISGRRKQRKELLVSDFAMERVDEVESVLDEQIKQLYNALEQVNEVEKALVLLYLEDKSYAEMEEILGLSQNALRVKMNRVKGKLRKIIKPE